MRSVRVFRVRGITVYVHWSAFVVAALILVSAVQRPVTTLCGLAAYAGVLLVHESGHAAMAQRRGYAVWSIEIYPIHGITRFDAPRSHFDRCLVAWGGVLAQAVIAIPLIAWVALFGYTSVEALNAVLALLGFFSFAMAAINLLPIPRLDGSLAWQLLPLLLRRRRSVQKRERAS